MSGKINVCFTGHRPDKLYGYDLNDTRYSALNRRIYDAISTLALEYDEIDFYSGGALGVDTLAFLLVNKLKRYSITCKIKNILAAPFLHQDVKWSRGDVERYTKIKRNADDVIYVDMLDDYRMSSLPIDTYHPDKMKARNRYMVDNSDIVIAIFDGSNGGTAHTVKYASKQGKKIITIGV